MFEEKVCREEIITYVIYHVKQVKRDGVSELSPELFVTNNFDDVVQRSKDFCAKRSCAEFEGDDLIDEKNPNEWYEDFNVFKSCDLMQISPESFLTKEQLKKKRLINRVNAHAIMSSSCT